MRLLPGAILGRYEIVELIGAGGMGEVYRARDGRLGREVAVKTVSAAAGARDDALRRFQDEARAVAALAHPNILAIFDLGSEGDTAFAVTELLIGESLERALLSGPLTLRRAVDVAIAVSEGLAAAHRRGILHRDLKPANVFLTFDGLVKILDFGLAQFLPVGGADTDGDTLDAGGVALAGTPAYMAPEQVLGKHLTPASDLFALGCVLFECLTGRRPFAGATMAETLASVLRDDPDVSAQRALPDAVRGIVLHCLEKSPEQRFQSANDVAFALRTALSQVDLGVAPLAAKPTIPVVCVLPFVCRSDDVDSDFLSEGVAESVINLLAALPQVRVIARTSSFRFRDSPLSPIGIATETGATWVLSGKITPHRGRLVVQSELVDGRTGAQTWGRRYVRETRDIFDLQEEIAREIAAELALELTSEQEAILAKRATLSSRAYELYLRGRFNWDRRTRSSVETAVRLFEAAIAEDATFALAYSGLADAYNVMSYHGWAPPERLAELSIAAARRAVELDDELPEALVSLGGALGTFDAGHRKESGAMFERALRLKPSYATAKHWLSHNWLCRGEIDRALVLAKEAAQLDPLSSSVLAWVGEVQYYARDYVGAADTFRRVLDLNPDSAFAHAKLGTILVAAGDPMAGYPCIAEAVRLEDSPRFQSLLAHAAAALGREDEARYELERLAQYEDAIPYDLALAWSALGETDRVLLLLEQARAARHERVAHAPVEPKLDGVRTDPGIAALLARLARSS